MGEKVGKFEDLEVWKESMRLAVKIYRTLNACRDYGLRDQMQRAAISIPSNIAEGYGGLEGEKGLEGVPPQRKFSEVKILDVRRVVNCFLCFRDKFSFLVPACPG